MVIRHDLLSCCLWGQHNQSGRSSFWWCSPEGDSVGCVVSGTTL